MDWAVCRTSGMYTYLVFPALTKQQLERFTLKWCIVLVDPHLACSHKLARRIPGNAAHVPLALQLAGALRAHVHTV
jgi:hypothetical protein